MIFPSDDTAKRASLVKAPCNPQSSKFASRSIGKFNQILPTGPTITQLKAESKQIHRQRQDGDISFRAAFGILGLPMLAILLICIAWTVLLTFLALEPNKAANLLMDTGAYDNGDFWMINDANPRITMAGAVGLMVVSICYLVLTLRMLFWRKKLLTSGYLSYARTWCTSDSRLRWWFGSICPRYVRVRLLWNELASFEGKYRKRWNAFLKLIDLMMETAMLRQLLANGSPTYLTYGFASFLAINSLSCVANILLDQFSALTEVFIDSIFDLSAAVLFPIVTLIYSYHNFDFDHEVYLTSLEALPPGSFEHLARTFANPSEMALFRVNIDSLRINSVLDLVLRISMNLTFCYRVKRVMEALIWTRHREYASGVIKSVDAPTQQNPVPKGVAVAFTAFSLMVLLSTYKAISDSKVACSAHPDCVVYAYKWKISDDLCPCVILIDVDLTPKTYKEWIDPVDAYDKVKALAASGRLTSLQIINRLLLEWPEELRLCHGLRTIQLIYTSTNSLPSWAKELKHLETLQIEGKYGDQNLLSLPDDLFSDMPHLSLVHFGIHDNLKRIPPFTGIPRLQTLSLGWMMRLREIPAFYHVPNLSRIVLSVLPVLEQMPDMSPLENLLEFVVYRPSAICCNGFVGTCDLKHSSCRGNSLLNIPPATCLKTDTDLTLAVTPFLGSKATQDAFENFAPVVCQESTVDKSTFLTFPTKETVEVCENKPFRQCRAPDNSIGICYNSRFQVIACLADENYIALRRLQIKKRVGPKCDPIEEKWLGCDE